MERDLRRLDPDALREINRLSTWQLFEATRRTPWFLKNCTPVYLQSKYFLNNLIAKPLPAHIETVVDNEAQIYIAGRDVGIIVQASAKVLKTEEECMSWIRTVLSLYTPPSQEP